MIFPLISLAIIPLALSTPLSKRDSNVLIVSNRRPGFCIGTTFIRGPRPGIGLDLVDCSSTAALRWDINRGDGYITVTGQNLVLTADSPGVNFGFLRVSFQSIHIISKL